MEERALVDKLVQHVYANKLNFSDKLELCVEKYCDFQRKIMTSHNTVVLIYASKTKMALEIIIQQWFARTLL